MKKDEIFTFNSENAVILLVSSDLEIKDLIKKSDASRGVIQFFDPDSILSEKHVIGSYLNALSAFESGTNVSKSMSVEMLLFAALTRQITAAIDAVGAKSNNRFLVFADGKNTLKSIRPYLKNETAFNPGKKHRETAAKKLGLKKEISEIELLQRIAVSRLSL